MGRKEDGRAGEKVLPNALADLRRDTKGVLGWLSR